MGVPMFRVFLALALTWSASSVQPQELADWFSSANGLQMSGSDATSLANANYQALTKCGVTLPNLRAMKYVMSDSGELGLDIGTIRSNILLLVEQHISPENLYKLYCHLSEGYTQYGGLGLSKAFSQTKAIKMALQRADPDNLYYLYKVMYGYGGLGFKQELAQTQAMQEALAGTDPDQFKESYTKSPNLPDAIFTSVEAYLQSLAKRYAKDGKLYAAKEFQEYYPTDWLTEWIAAPMEKKVSADKLAYTAGSFSRHYGSTWASKWRTANTATQLRLADDGKTYTMQQFQQYYTSSWQTKFAAAPELPCSECVPYDGAVVAADLVV